MNCNSSIVALVSAMLLMHGITPAHGEELWILSTGALTKPLQNVAESFCKRKDCELVFNTFNSERVKRAVLYGLTEAHLVMLRSLKNVRELVQAGRVYPDYHVLCFSRWVIIVPEGNTKGITGIHDLGRTGVRIGVASKVKGKVKPTAYQLPIEIAIAAGIKDAYLKNVVADFDCVRRVAEAVAKRTIDAAIVEERIAYEFKGKVKVIPIPMRYLLASELYRDLSVFVVAVVKGTNREATAREMVNLLLSDDVQRLLARYGFIPVRAFEPHCFLKDE